MSSLKEEPKTLLDCNWLKIAPDGKFWNTPVWISDNSTLKLNEWCHIYNDQWRLTAIFCSKETFEYQNKAHAINVLNHNWISVTKETYAKFVALHTILTMKFYEDEDEKIQETAS